MNKILFALIFLLVSSSSLGATVEVVGKVTFLEVSYMPGTVVFRMDTGSGACPAGAILRWSKPDIENNKAVYSTLLAALASGRKIRFHFESGDAMCMGTYLHILSE